MIIDELENSSNEKLTKSLVELELKSHRCPTSELKCPNLPPGLWKTITMTTASSSYSAAVLPSSGHLNS